MIEFPQGSEYGGRPGVIQPRPHNYLMDAGEQLGLTVRTDSADPTSGLEKVYVTERQRDDRRPV